MTSVLWYILSTIVSLILSAFVFNFFGQIIAENPTIQSDKMDFIFSKISELEHYFIDVSFGYKALICLTAIVIVILLLLFCRLDEHLKKLPFGEVLEDFFGDSPFEDKWFLRLIPGGIFTIYVFIRFGVGCFNSKIKFDIGNFSLTGQGYTFFEWITQVFYFLIIFAMIWMILDSFLSAGLIGGIFHAIAITTANLIMLFLGLLLGAFTVIIILLALAVIVVIIVIKIILLILYLFV